MLERYIGTKIIEARPMTLGEYNEYRDWEIPADADPSRKGYLVVYPDGYESWSPKDQFEEAYRMTFEMNFGLAIEAMKKGLKVFRKGWNGKGMWIIFVPGTAKASLMEGHPYRHAGIDRPIDINGRFDMHTAKGTMQPGWLASQEDMAADDWVILPK